MANNKYKYKRLNTQVLAEVKKLSEQDASVVNRSIQVLAYDLEVTNTETGEVTNTKKYDIVLKNRKWIADLKNFFDVPVTQTFSPEEFSAIGKIFEKKA